VRGQWKGGGCEGLWEGGGCEGWEDVRRKDKLARRMKSGDGDVWV